MKMKICLSYRGNKYKIKMTVSVEHCVVNTSYMFLITVIPSVYGLIIIVVMIA